MVMNWFMCDICNKRFQRDHNLQLHWRGHNLPWKLQHRTGTEPRKRVYLCPEPTCSKKYVVQSDWNEHSNTCGTKEHRCGCGTLFSRKDSFITHRAFCDALAVESARVNTAPPPGTAMVDSKIAEEEPKLQIASSLPISSFISSGVVSAGEKLCGTEKIMCLNKKNTHAQTMVEEEEEDAE